MQDINKHASLEDCKWFSFTFANYQYRGIISFFFGYQVIAVHIF